LKHFGTALGLFGLFALLVAACGRTPVSLGDQTTGSLVGGGSNDGGGGQGGAGPGPGPGPGPGGSGGSGGAPPCFTDADCNDADFCTTDRCETGFCEYSSKDDDEDGFIAEVCGGNDCNDLNPNTHPGLPENCFDGDDNDCNGVFDCLDPACFNVPNCGCQADPGGEDCGNGLDDDCDTTVDCNDADCIGTPACGCAPEETICDDGIDDNCNNLIDCDDSDCFDAIACTCQAIDEQCGNGEDEDCDFLIDCADPDCFGSFNCTCMPPGVPEVCTDNNDNDCDTLVDCADGDCAASPACQMCAPEVCDNGVDDDCDNLIDCADDSCNFAPNCTPVAEICNNSIDDDNDGLTDCDDPDCVNNPLCALQGGNCLTAKLITGSGTFFGDTEGFVNKYTGACGGGAGEAVYRLVLNQPSFVHLDTIGTTFDSVLHVRLGDCETGAEIACDDDSGGFQWSASIDFPILYPGSYFIFVDGFTVDPQLGANDGPYTFNVQIIENPSEICGDGVDNDGDIFVDCADSDCTNVGACVNCLNGGPPGPEYGIFACTDGVDNDCDGLPDCIDDDCSASPYAITECCNGMDQNDNGIPDDFSCRCATNNDCAMGSICYTHTTHTCGFPCDQFFGEVCPAVALGSFCSLATSQCEFL
jgi:hypothetical protein